MKMNWKTLEDTVRKATTGQSRRTSWQRMMMMMMMFYMGVKNGLSQ